MRLKLLFITSDLSLLADPDSKMLTKVKEALLKTGSVEEVFSPDTADALIIQEKESYKDFRYIKSLQKDAFINEFASKVYTINRDDCATGLLRGLYTSLPKARFDPAIHASVPYMEYPNKLIFSQNLVDEPPFFLASWRGNTKSNKIRSELIKSLKSNPELQIEATDSWLNHQKEEKERYIQLIRHAKFSLCPAGWAPVSFRIYESMALGRCPVIIADEFVPPPGPNWNEFALFYPQNKTDQLYSFLKEHEGSYSRLGQAAYQYWKEYFSPDVVAGYLANSLLKLLFTAPETTRQHEIKRWNSFQVHWTNHWTLPQRIHLKVNKVFKMALPF
ncbi:exostosin family protein [Rufibacter hautae]|uniref:Exostosin family protein n=2 Tax=Rufibacter hautae TaxID=2595005 RepID=A0A5B6TGS1_9BACT|nr:exostosin family protein [Rufibacter hautae]